MINTLYLPELREMLAENRTEEMAEFCTAVHAGVTAEFMSGLTPPEAWRVLQYAEPFRRCEIFGFFSQDKQLQILEREEREEIAQLIEVMSPDDRVDILEEMDQSIVDELLSLLSHEERRNVIRLREYPDSSAGSVMTTDVAKLEEHLTVSQALAELGHQAEELETIYYLYVVTKTTIYAASSLLNNLSVRLCSQIKLSRS